MREERFFVPDIGESLNQCLRQKGWLIYKGVKKRMGNAMVAADAHHIEPFVKPIQIVYRPRIIRGPSGHISKQFDVLNFGITYKIIEDWLVKFKVIKDDNREWVYGAYLLRSELAEDGIMGVDVLLQEVETATTLGFQEPLMLPEEKVF